MASITITFTKVAILDNGCGRIHIVNLPDTNATPLQDRVADWCEQNNVRFDDVSWAQFNGEILFH